MAVVPDVMVNEPEVTRAALGERLVCLEGLTLNPTVDEIPGVPFQAARDGRNESMWRWC